MVDATEECGAITRETSAMTRSKETIGLGARAELRVWYLGRLRPRMVEAVMAGIVRPAAVEELDLQVAELFELPSGGPQIPCSARMIGPIRTTVVDAFPARPR